MKPFKMKMLGLLSFALLITAACTKLEEDAYPVQAEPPAFPEDDWQKVANPAQFGWSADKLNEVREYAEDIRTRSLILIDNGRLVAAWGDTKEKYYVASVRKSYLSNLYGFYVGDNISLDATLAEYGIDDKNPPLNDTEKRATVRQLLTSSSGVYHRSAASDSDDLPARNSTTPGQTFFYNNWDFNALGTIFEKRTGKKIFEVYNEKIAQPIGMQDFNWQKDGRYDFSDVSVHPAYHFDMTARDMARFGLLILNKGAWKGEQIIPADWLAESTREQMEVPDSYGGGGYGYMWWVNNDSKLNEANVPADAFSAQGNWSQLILIIPSKNLVIVHRGYRKDIDAEKLLKLLTLLMEAKA